MSTHTPRQSAPQDLREQAPSASPSLPVQMSRPTSTCVLIQARGELDANSARHLHELLAPRLSSAAETLVLDLSQLDFVGVPGLELLSHTHQQAHRRGMQLRLVTGPRCLARALLAAEMTDSFACYGDLEHALAGLTGCVRDLAAVS